MVLPSVALPDAQGVAHRLSDWAGHPLVVNFWATWCEPCRREIPLLIRLRHERAADGLVVVGIAIDFRAAVVKYAAANAIDYPLLIGEDAGLKIVDAFGMDLVFPFSVFADRDGRVVAVKVGELHRDEADFILDRVDEIDRGTLSLAGAREAITSRLRLLAVERAKHA
jgi:thiol-disulfide isomerase/thioredoxin